jgi:hypothetical protein
MNEYLSFRRFITPTMIQIIFWIGIAGIVLASLMMIVRGLDAPYGGGSLLLMGLLYLVFGSLFWRIWCELLLIIFRIYDELHLMRTGRSSDAMTPPTA